MSVMGVGITGDKYPCRINGKITKEYNAWASILNRCYGKKYEKYETYKDVVCCNEWLYYPNFYEWLHSQENFEQWFDGDKWAVDKDILIKGNKIYSPDTCCLIPNYVNNLPLKHDIARGDFPIGVKRIGDMFEARCSNKIHNKLYVYLGKYKTIEEAFQVYKQYKESLIKQIAKEEYTKGNITKRCYEAMMNYEVEITD